MWQKVTLGRVRLLVQLVMLFLMVYGGSLVGYYAAEKISNALPALSCAYDKQTGAYCVLIPLQHQLHHRVGEALVAAQAFSFNILLPLFFTILSFLAFYVVLGKAFCGWVCPLGTVQELVGKLGRRLNLQPRFIAPEQVGKVRPVKWLMLLALVLLFPLLAGMGVTPHATGDAFCQVCPSRIMTTVMTGDWEQLAVATSDATSVVLGVVANLLFGFILLAALAYRQPFCRGCPLLAWNALFQKFSLMRLVKVEHARCDKCGVCHQACPMDIPEIWREHGSKAFHEDCILCGRCAEFCPDDHVIHLQWGPWRWFSSARDYYRARTRVESPKGEIKRASVPLANVRQALKQAVDKQHD